MHALAFFAMFSAVVSARSEKARMPSSLIPRQKLSEMSVEEASNSCGDNQQISCCNKIEQGDDIDEANGVLSGLLNGVLSDGLALADQCSAISVTALIGVSNLLNDQCTSTVACCQGNEGSAEGGLININIPCIAIGSLIG